MRVFAIDPGIGTGWAWANVDASRLRENANVRELMEGGELKWTAGEVLATDRDPYEMDRHLLYELERKAAAKLWKIMDGFGADLLVIEDFTVYGNKAQAVSAGGAVPLAPVRVGSMLALAAELGVIEVRYQMASLGKTTITKDRLKRWGFWTVGSEHARDATRHLLTYLRRFAAGEVE